MSAFQDLTGMKFYRLLVLEQIGKNKWGDILWKCLCDCGNFTLVSTKHLKSGEVKSCGCLHLEVSLKNLQN